MANPKNTRPLFALKLCSDRGTLSWLSTWQKGWSKIQKHGAALLSL